MKSITDCFRRVSSSSPFCSEILFPVCCCDSIFIFVNVFECSDKEMYKHTNTSVSRVECDYFYPGQYWCVLIIHGRAWATRSTEGRELSGAVTAPTVQEPKERHPPKPVLLAFSGEFWEEKRQEGRGKEGRMKRDRGRGCKQQQSTRKCLLNVKNFCLILRKCSMLSVAAWIKWKAISVVNWALKCKK